MLEAIAGVQETADAIEAKTDGMPVVAHDSFHDREDGFVAQYVQGVDGREFLANITVHCSFGTFDNNTDKNVAS